MELIYFVTYKLYNTENNGWAYKYELKTSSYDEAVRKFGELIKQYYGNAPFGFGCITIEDMYGNTIDRKYWDNTSKEE